MKNKQKYFFATIIFVITAILSGCSEDSLLSNEIGSTLEENDSYKISTFSLSNNIMGADESVDRVTINLKSENITSLQYSADVIVSNSTMKCRMMIPKTESIPDGNYVLTAILPDNTKLGGCFKVVFKNDMLRTIQEEQIEYTKLNGEGTEENPYIINSTDDFKSLINNLRRDSLAHGAGRYFKQTATFDAPSQSELYDGRSYYNYAFAGKYDGGGFSIENLFYVGAKEASKDSGIGLFTDLYDGAEIKNLGITNLSIMNTTSDCGVIAGSASGNIALSDIRVNGTIMEGGSRCGGLIGSLDGNLSVDGYDLSLNISGDNEVGGLLGYAGNSSTVNIHSVTTTDHHFSISGGENVGGIIGKIDGEFHIARVVLEHTVSSEDDKVKIINSSGNYLGGVIGNVSNVTSASSFDSIKIKCPIGGVDNATPQYVGGLAGYVNSNAPLTVNYCQMTSVISGGSDLGGLIGSCNLSGSNVISFIGADTDTTKVVVDGAAATITGISNVGGLFGYLNGTAKFDSPVRVAIDVTSTDRNCGGAIGSAENSELDLSNLILDSYTMKVKGGGECTGGIIGYIGNSSVCGPSSNKFDYVEGNSSSVVVPQYSRFTPMFCGFVDGKNKNGGIIGKMCNVTVKQLSAQCTVSGSGQYTGGLVGWASNASSFEDSTFGGERVDGNGSDTGGIVGYIADTTSLRDCINYGAVNGVDNVGGVIGYVDYSSGVPGINWCVNTGAVTASGGRTGGVVGYMHGGYGYTAVRRCANYGAIEGTGGDSSNDAVGGIVGMCDDVKIRVWNCANHGKVHCTGAQHGVGGIAGALGFDPGSWWQSENLDLGYCCNRGEVGCDSKSAHVGGILGYQEEGGSDEDDYDSHLHNCINFGDITSDQDSDNGGILGYADSYSYIEKCVNFGKMNDVDDDNATIGDHKGIFSYDYLYYLEGTGSSWKSTDSFTDSEKGKEDTYDGFDFSNVWEIVDGYPALRDCPFQSVYFEK